MDLGIHLNHYPPKGGCLGQLVLYQKGRIIVQCLWQGPCCFLNHPLLSEENKVARTMSPHWLLAWAEDHIPIYSLAGTTKAENNLHGFLWLGLPESPCTYLQDLVPPKDV